MAKPVIARPFVKWAGGKGQLLKVLSELFPRTIRTYYEPMLGGGAVFFALAAQGRFKHAVLNDTNQDLMDCFKVVRDFPDALIEFLRQRAASYAGGPQAMYDHWRRTDPKSLDPVARAGRLVFLNRTCFNGLYRVNKKGEFNVPFGRYENPRICDETNLRACAAVLDRFATIRSCDFAEALEGASEGDLVYLDPPYVPLTTTSNFTTYTADGFKLEDHRRLAALFQQLVDQGVSVVLSNSDTEFVRNLYAGYEIHPVQAKRNINSKGDKRGPVGELIIVGRPVAATEPEPIPVAPEVFCTTCGEAYPSDIVNCPQCVTTPPEVALVT